jgi:hypothetical protein
MARNTVKITPFQARGSDEWSNAVLQFGPRFNPPIDATMILNIFHRTTDGGISVLLELDKVRALHEYLDMEDAGNFIACDVQTTLVVYQEEDGTTFFRTYWNGSGRSKLIYVSDEDTGRLYEWLGDALAGNWNGWKHGA